MQDGPLPRPDKQAIFPMLYLERSKMHAVDSQAFG